MLCLFYIFPFLLILDFTNVLTFFCHFVTGGGYNLCANNIDLVLHFSGCYCYAVNIRLTNTFPIDDFGLLLFHRIVGVCVIEVIAFMYTSNINMYLYFTIMLCTLRTQFTTSVQLVCMMILCYV